MTSTSTTPRSGWFYRGWFDVVFILGTPLLVWPLVKQVESAWSGELLLRLILLTATGHYFATFVRAYGDKELFARFRGRFTLVPIILGITCVTAFVTETTAALLLLAGMWAFWHWLAQAFGFARIYDAKVGSVRPATARLDKLLVVTWFLGAVVLNQRATGNFAELFLNCSIALPGAGFFATLRAIVLGAVIAVSVAYVANVALSISRGEPVSWIKQACHVMTIGFYWFAFGYVGNFFVGYVLYELFHDIQYFAIVWLSGRARVQREGVRPWMRWLFRPGTARVMLFVAAMVAFGAIDMETRQRLAGDVAGDVLKGLFLCAALLHYYYDGFIWRVREGTTRSDLGIAGGTHAIVRNGLAHAGAWGVFFVPLALLTARQDTAFGDEERAAMMFAAVPESFESQANQAFELVSKGEFDAGLALYKKSVTAFPGWAKTQFNFAAALDFHGDLNAAIHHYELALACPDEDELHAQAHRNLGVCEMVRGAAAAARQHFARSEARLGPDSSRNRFRDLAAAVERAGHRDRALVLRRAAVTYDGNDLSARLALADQLGRLRRLSAAASEYLTLLGRAPRHAEALAGLATTRLEQRRPDDARRLLERALAADPNNARARELQQRLR